MFEDFFEVGATLGSIRVKEEMTNHSLALVRSLLVNIISGKDQHGNGFCVAFSSPPFLCWFLFADEINKYGSWFVFSLRI